MIQPKQAHQSVIAFAGNCGQIYSGSGFPRPPRLSENDGGQAAAILVNHCKSASKV